MLQRYLCCIFLVHGIILVGLLSSGNNAQHIGDCSFQTDFCGYTAASDNVNFVWSRLRSATPTLNTGPQSDHNNVKTAFYVYTESSDPAEVSNTASLTSPLITDTAPLCLKFWYHAFGNGMGSLRVYLKGQNGESRELFRSDGNKGNEWINKNINLTNNDPFQIQFVSERGIDFTSDMAIDDVEFTAGICTRSTEPETSEPTKPPPIEPKPYVPAHIYGVERLGCYKDERRRAFPKRYAMNHDKDPLTYVDNVKRCRDYVDSKGEEYKVFGVQYYGHECFYGSINDDNTDPFKYGVATNCQYETVGGSWSNYVYLSCKDEKSCADEKPPTPPPPPQSMSEITGIQQIGCFGDSGRRALPKLANLDNKRDTLGLLLNVRKCRDIALKAGGLENGYEFFAVEYYFQCFYGSNKDSKTEPFKYGFKTCPNNISGGAWTMMVYRLYNNDSVPMSQIPGLPSPPPKTFADITEIEKIGCFGDSNSRALPHYAVLDGAKDPLTLLKNVQTCRDIAKKNGGHYFAVQYWRQCFYGSIDDSRTQPFKYGRKTCPNEVTGGAWTQMVYRLIKQGNVPLAQLALPPPLPKSISDITGIEKIGCFGDSRVRALPRMANLDRARDTGTLLKNVQTCRDIAKKSGAYYFAVQYWFQCFYGSKEDSRSKPFRYGRRACPNEFTGGPWTQMVYRLVTDGMEPIAQLPGFPPPLPTSLSDVTGIEKVGCYGDGHRRAFPTMYNLMNSRATQVLLQNVQRCRDIAKERGGLARGYEYFAVEYWFQCFLGSNNDRRTQPKKYGKKNCPNEIAGGSWTMMVYKLTE